MGRFKSFQEKKEYTPKSRRNCSEFLGKKEDYLRAKDTTPSYYVYIVECLDGSYYIGYTSDLSDRIIRHKMGNGAEYTKENGFKRLVYFETHVSERYAKRREFYIQQAGRVYSQMIVTEFQKNLMLLDKH